MTKFGGAYYYAFISLAEGGVIIGSIFDERDDDRKKVKAFGIKIACFLHGLDALNYTAALFQQLGIYLISNRYLPTNVVKVSEIMGVI